MFCAKLTACWIILAIRAGLVLCLVFVVLGAVFDALLDQLYNEFVCPEGCGNKVRDMREGACGFLGDLWDIFFPVSSRG